MTSRPFGAADIREALRIVCGEVADVLAGVDADAVNRLVAAIEAADRIYVTGMGRSGLAAAAFAMRLVHLGFVSHVVGEVTAPAVRAGDLLLAISGSGGTRTVVAQAEAALAAGCRLAAVTGIQESLLGRLAAAGAGRVVIPSCLGVRHQVAGMRPTRQFGGSLFEQSTFLLLDAMILVLAARKGKTDQDMVSRHTNLE